MALHDRFRDLTFEAFRSRALDATLSEHEKVGFPDEYREGRVDTIFADILSKLPALHERDRTVLEIGPGCSGLPRRLIDHCARQAHRLVLVDSDEMLRLLPDADHITKLPGRYPQCHAALAEYVGRVDALLSYSVIQYVFAEDNLWAFLDGALALLAPGGHMLLADIPNASMRRRFLMSAAGRAFHRSYTGRDEVPDIASDGPQPGQMDDAVVFSLLMRARAAGFHAFVVPQHDALPMANRREDLLIRRP